MTEAAWRYAITCATCLVLVGLGMYGLWANIPYSEWVLGIGLVFLVLV